MRRWLVELTQDPAGDDAQRERLLAAGATIVPTFNPQSLPGPRGPSRIWLVELVTADVPRIRALPEFVGMVPDVPLAPTQSRQ